MRFPPGCLRHVALLLCVSCLVDLCVEPASVCSGRGRRPVGRCRRRLDGLPGGLSCQLLSGVPTVPPSRPARPGGCSLEALSGSMHSMSKCPFQLFCSLLMSCSLLEIILRCSMHIHRHLASNSAEGFSQSSDCQRIHRSAAIGFD